MMAIMRLDIFRWAWKEDRVSGSRFRGMGSTEWGSGLVVEGVVVEEAGFGGAIVVVVVEPARQIRKPGALWSI